MVLIWNEHLSIGNAMLDSEHQRLLEMINNIECAIGTRDSFALLGALKLFRDGVDRRW